MASASPRCLQYVHVYIRESMHTVIPLTDSLYHFRSQEFSSGGSGVGPPVLSFHLALAFAEQE